MAERLWGQVGACQAVTEVEAFFTSCGQGLNYCDGQLCSGSHSGPKAGPAALMQGAAGD
jgi:hypothetical protein